MAKHGFIGGMARVIVEAFRKTDFGMIMRRSASLAYYAALSLAPLLVIALAVASLVFDRSTIRTSIVAEMRQFVGDRGAELFAGLLADSADEDKSSLAIVIGFVTLLVGATAVFVELQDGLNAIWEVRREKGRAVWTFIKTRLLSAAMVVSFGFLLLVSLLVSAALSAVTKRLHLGELAVVGWVLNFLVSVFVTGILFAILFKFLPDVRIRWRDVWFGAFATAILFNLGQIAIGQYLGRAGVGSAYGAAGSLVIVLVWVYYSGAILFFGAELTQARARLSGRAIEPKPGAGMITSRSRPAAQPG
jgi:membrane protein